MSLLLPHINERTPSATTSSSNTVTAALIQRVKVLQDENDELYELLKSGETGRLKDDVRALQRVVQKLEGALRGTQAPGYPQCMGLTKLASRIASSDKLSIVSLDNKYSRLPLTPGAGLSWRKAKPPFWQTASPTTTIIPTLTPRPLRHEPRSRRRILLER